MSISNEQRHLLSQGAYMAAGGWAIIAAILILARLGLWAFWPVLLVIGFVLAGLSIAPAWDTDSEDEQ